MREYYKAQLIDLGKRMVIGIICGVIVGFIAGSTMADSRGLCMFMFGIIGGCFPQGLRISSKVNEFLPGLIVLPVIGWLILWVIKLAVIIYGGLFATPILAIYYGVRMAACPKEA